MRKIRALLAFAVLLAGCHHKLAPGETRCVYIGNGVTKCKSGPPVQATDAGGER